MQRVSIDVMQQGSIDVVLYHLPGFCLFLSVSGHRRWSVCASSRRRGCRRETPPFCPLPSGPWGPTPPPPPSNVSHARTHTYPHVPTVISCTRSHAHVPSPTHTYVVVTLPHNPLCSHLHGCYKTLWALAVADSPEAHGLLTMTFSLMSPAALRSGPSV